MQVLLPPGYPSQLPNLYWNVTKDVNLFCFFTEIHRRCESGILTGLIFYQVIGVVYGTIEQPGLEGTFKCHLVQSPLPWAGATAKTLPCNNKNLQEIIPLKELLKHSSTATTVI